MKVLFLTNNDITTTLSEWLENDAKEEVLRFSEKITLSHINTFCPDFVISYNYKYITGEDVIGLVSGRIINLHISLLPWNKGADPNFWSFVENTPKGVTIHRIVPEIDAGDILLQKELTFNERDETLKSSYDRLHNEIQKLFISNWNRIKNGQVPAKVQQGDGSFHYSRETSAIKTALGQELWTEPINLLKQKLKDMSLI